MVLWRSDGRLSAHSCALSLEDTTTVIKRRYVHLAFALICAGLAGTLLLQAWHLQQINHLSAKLAAVPDTLNTNSETSSLPTVESPEDGAFFSDEPSTEPSVEQSDEQWVEQSADSSDTSSAVSTTASTDSPASDGPDTSVYDDEHPAVQLALGGAQFNLANLYLRQALASGTITSSDTLPMVELAKQRYRDLLRVMPEHWPARYNLERALNMAPEGTDRVGDERIEPLKSVDVIVPGFEKKELP